MRIDRGELFSPQVEDYLESQAALRRDVEDVEPQPLIWRVLFSSWFYLAVASGLGALVACVVLEPSFNDREMAVEEVLGALQGEDVFHPIQLLMFPTVTAFAGLFVGAAEGLMCRNLGRAAWCGLVGGAIGFVAGCVLELPAGMIYNLLTTLAGEAAFPHLDAEITRLVLAMQAEGRGNREIAEAVADIQVRLEMTGFPLLLQMIGRSLAWAIVGIAAGIGQGIALKQRKVIVNGLVGGLLGGLAGGLLFDPLAMFLRNDVNDAWLSRSVGFTVIGVLVGLFIGLVETWTKTAWLLMRKGPLAGKQFVIYRETTVLGSSPRAEIYLFKDDAIEPRHALIRNRGGRFEIEDLDTPDGTYVNGSPVHRQFLHNGDQIVLGRTVLEFSLRETD
ncbi:MAG: FHA domain-containing protein [Planctomycetes bacterium]|nr:FHA domain-containing protein [Planctomycetota bacterium]